MSNVKYYAKRGQDEPCCDSKSDMVLHDPCGEVSECEACGATFTYDFNYPSEDDIVQSVAGEVGL